MFNQKIYDKEYYKKHAEERKAYSRNYGKTHKIQAARRVAKWKENHLEYFTSFKRRYIQLNSGAKTRNLSQNISFEQYIQIIKDDICNYCKGSLPKKGGSLDRLNPQLGYELQNVVPCCKNCNYQKGALERAGFTYPRLVELMAELHVN